MLDQASLDTLFVHARTHSVWLDTPVSDEQLRSIYDVMKWGPTSANSSPARIVSFAVGFNTRSPPWFTPAICTL